MAPGNAEVILDVLLVGDPRHRASSVLREDRAPSASFRSRARGSARRVAQRARAGSACGGKRSVTSRVRETSSGAKAGNAPPEQCCKTGKLSFSSSHPSPPAGARETDKERRREKNRREHVNPRVTHTRGPEGGLAWVKARSASVFQPGRHPQFLI